MYEAKESLCASLQHVQQSNDEFRIKLVVAGDEARIAKAGTPAWRLFFGAKERARRSCAEGHAQARPYIFL